MKEIVDYLKILHHKFNMIVNNEKKFFLTFVLNNISCDMDSVLSSVFYSFIKNVRSNSFYLTNIKDEITFNIYDKNNLLFLPLMNCRKSELESRLDVQELLAKIKIDSEDFLYFEDVFDLDKNDIYKLGKQEDFNIILVDHFELDAKQRILAEKVIEIVDHRNDIGFEYERVYKNLIFRKVEFVRCSTMSILLEIFLQDQNLKKLMTENNFFDILLSSQILDTEGFKKVYLNTRFIEKDYTLCIDIIDLCRRSCFYKEEEYYCEDYNFHLSKLFERLHNAKYDIQKNLALGLKSLIDKDKKNLIFKNEKILWASLHIKWELFVEKFSWKEIKIELIRRMKEENYSLFIILANSLSNNRILIVWGSNSKEFLTICENLSKEISTSLENHYISSHYEDDRFEILLDETISRKLIIPLFQKII